MIPAYTAELALLIRASLKNKPFLSEANVVDPIRMMEMAHRHQVAVQLHEYLNLHPAMSHAADMDSLKEYSVQGAVYNMIFLRQSLEIIQDLTSNGQRAFLMKGALWAWMLYEKPSLREFGDIDIFFHTDDIPKGVQILGDHGYVADGYRNFLLSQPEVAQSYFKTDYQLPMVPQSDAIVKSLELQWNTTYPRFGYTFTWQELMKDPMIFPVLGQEIAVPSKENQLLMMVIHHAGVEQWDKLKYMSDFVRLLEKFEKELNWSYVKSMAHQKGFYRLLLESLGMVRTLTGADYLQYCETEETTKYPSPSLLSATIQHWEDERTKPITKSWQIFYFNMRYRDSLKIRLHILRKHIGYLLEWRLLIPKARFYRKNRQAS